MKFHDFSPFYRSGEGIRSKVAGDRLIDNPAVADAQGGSGASFNFDGTDQVTTTADTLTLSASASAEAWFKTVDDSAGQNTIVAFGGAWASASMDFAIQVNGGNLITYNWRRSGAELAHSTTRNVTDGEWHHVVSTYVDGAGNTGENKIYLDGVLISTANNVKTFGGSGTGEMAIGSSSWGSTQYFNGEISGVKYHNRALSAAEVRAAYNGQAVPYEYVGASQDELVTNGTMEATGGIVETGQGASGVAPDSWVLYRGVGSYDTTTEYDGSQSFKIGNQASNTGYLYSEWHGDGAFSLIKGKKYRLSFYAKATGSGGSCSEVSGNGNFNSIDIPSTTTDWTLFTQDFSPSVATAVSSTVIGFYADEHVTVNTNSITIDNITLKQIGCVAEYLPSGVGHGMWLDGSGNELHGSVSGATAIGIDSNHREKYVDLTVTGDTSFALPKGYRVAAITTKETAGYTLGGGMDVGTTNGGGEVVAAHAITASTTAIATIVASGSIGGTHTTADDTLYITDADGTGWDSASVEVRVEMERLIV